MSDSEDLECPLCMEEIDVTDRYFKPCPCGYQICRFCWNHIMTDLNAKCPACRRVYDEKDIEFKPVPPEELARIKSKKKRKEREKKEQDQQSKRHLASARIVQKNLVYVLGLPNKICTEEALRSQEYFGQFGKIIRVMVNKRGHGHAPLLSQVPSNYAGVYITYARKEDATRAIDSIDGTLYDNKVIRATYGTTKYCTYYLKGQNCQNPGCSFLHEPGEEADLFAKEELTRIQSREKVSKVAPFPAYTGSFAAGIPLSQVLNHTLATSNTSIPGTPTSTQSANGIPSAKGAAEESSALPATASWAKISSGSARGSTSSKSGTPTSIAATLAASNGNFANNTIRPRPVGGHSAAQSISSITSGSADNGDHIVPESNNASRSSSRANLNDELQQHGGGGNSNKKAVKPSALTSTRSMSGTSNGGEFGDEGADMNGNSMHDIDSGSDDDNIALGSAALRDDDLGKDYHASLLKQVGSQNSLVPPGCNNSISGFLNKSISVLNAPYYSYTGFFEGGEDAVDYLYMLRLSPLSLGFTLQPKYTGLFDPFRENPLEPLITSTQDPPPPGNMQNSQPQPNIN